MGDEENHNSHTSQRFTPESGVNALHEVLLSSPASKDIQKEYYAKWAPTYDVDILSKGTKTDLLLRDLLFEHCKASPMRLMDAGCGTGLSLRAIRPEADRRSLEMFAVGVDYSPEMLELAAEKKWHQELVCADLEEHLPISTESFDAFVSSGLFIAGHCGPSVLVNIVRCLKMNGVGVFTIRRNTYIAEEKEYLDAIRDVGCEVVFNEECDYFGGLTANFVVIKRTRKCIQ